MLPLQESVDYQDDDESSIENELKQLFIALFETHLRTKFRRIDHFGYPHLLDEADFEAVQRFIKLEGLSLLNRETDNQPYMREVFRAWRGQHSRRGLGFLAFYLQMLWPNTWQIIQKNHFISSEGNYPFNLTVDETTNTFLTSRVDILLDRYLINNHSELSKIIPALKRVVPARIVLNVVLDLAIIPTMEIQAGIAFSPTMCIAFEDSSLL